MSFYVEYDLFKAVTYLSVHLMFYRLKQNRQRVAGTIHHSELG